MQKLAAKPRIELGRKANALRGAGFLPAVLYGAKVQSQPLMVPLKDFEKVYREAGESSLIELEVDGQKHNVLIHDISRDPLKGSPTHADFYAVRMDKPIKARVRVEFVGEAPAVKNFSGILVKVMHEIEVEALPKDLPPEIVVDLSSLTELNSRIHVKEVSFPPGVKTTAHDEDTVVLVEEPRSEAELEELQKAPVEEVLTEVKTEREVKAEAEEKTVESVEETKEAKKEASGTKEEK